MSLRVRHALLATSLTVIALVATGPAVGHAATTSAEAKAHNANFKGKWDMSNGYSFTVKRENTKTGKCTGTSSYGPGYKFGGCKVHGHHFRFVITAKSDGAYSDYRGGFSAHKLHRPMDSRGRRRRRVHRHQGRGQEVTPVVASRTRRLTLGDDSPRLSRSRRAEHRPRRVIPSVLHASR